MNYSEVMFKIHDKFFSLFHQLLKVLLSNPTLDHIIPKLNSLRNAFSTSNRSRRALWDSWPDGSWYNTNWVASNWQNKYLKYKTSICLNIYLLSYVILVTDDLDLIELYSVSWSTQMLLSLIEHLKSPTLYI